MIAASIWLSFLEDVSVGFAGFDSLASRLATVASLVLGLAVCATDAFFALRAFVVALVVLVLVVIVLVSVVWNGLAAIFRPGEPPPSDPDPTGISASSRRPPKPVWFRTRAAGLRRCRAPHRRLRRRRRPGHLRRPHR